MDERILITGGCGFIGTNLTLELIDSGYSNITIVDVSPRVRWDPKAWSNRSIDLVQMDIRSKELVALLRRRGVTTVIHLAAIHYIPYCDQNPSEAWSVNVDGTQAVLDASLDAGVRRFFMASTAAVYKSSLEAHTEDSALEAMDIYGKTKLKNEEQVRIAANKDGLCASIGRIFNVAGAYETNPHLIPAIIERAKTSRRVKIGNSESKRDYIHARDVSRAVISITFGAEQPLEICNIGTGKAYSAPQIIGLLSGVLGEKIDFLSAPKLQRVVDRPMLRADITRIVSRFGWQPVYSLQQALADAIAYQAQSPLFLGETEE